MDALAGAKPLTPWHAEIDFSGWVVARIPIFRRADCSLSVGVPSAPEVDRDGVQQRDAAGKRKFWSMISFTGNSRDRWNRMVLAALADAGIMP